MTDTTPGGWPDAARPGYPKDPERDGEHMMEWTDEHGRVWREVWKWRTDSKPPLWLRPNFTGGPYGYEPKHLTAPIYASVRYLGPCQTPAEVAALVEAARREEREACASLSVRVEVPPGAETWSPLEAWQEALVMLDAAFRAAIRARGDA